MYNNTTRTFAFYNLTFLANAAQFKVLDAYPVLNHINWLINAYNKKSNYIFANKRKSYYIKDLVEESDHIILLVKYLDGFSRNITNENIRTHEVKNLTKTKDEGRAFTSHIYISKVPVNNKLKMIVEENEGFALGTLSVMLTRIIRAYLLEHGKLTVKFPHPTGKKKDNKDVMIKKWPVVEARGTLANSLEQEFEDAEVSEINFISYSRQRANLEGFERLKEKRSVVRVTVTDKAVSRFSFDSLKRLAAQNRDQFDEVAITYKHAKTRAATAHLECDQDFNAINAERLIKKVIIDAWKSEIEDSYDEIQHEVKAAILEMKND